MTEGYRPPYKICRCGHAQGHHAGRQCERACRHYDGCECLAFVARSTEE